MTIPETRTINVVKYRNVTVEETRTRNITEYRNVTTPEIRTYNVTKYRNVTTPEIRTTNITKYKNVTVEEIRTQNVTKYKNVTKTVTKTRVVIKYKDITTQETRTRIITVTNHHYKLYIYLLYLEGKISYEDLVAIIGLENIHFDENGQIVIDFDSLEDIPDDITVSGLTDDTIPTTDDNIDTSNPSGLEDPVIDAGIITTEL